MSATDVDKEATGKVPGIGAMLNSVTSGLSGISNKIKSIRADMAAEDQNARKERDKRAAMVAGLFGSSYEAPSEGLML